MTVEAARAFFRSQERQLMNSTVTVKRDNGDATYDSDTNTYNQPETTVYNGDALVLQNSWEGSDRDVGDTEIRLRTWRVKLPHDAAQLYRNDRVTVDTSANSNLTDRTFRVTDFFGDDRAPSAPYFCEEVN